MPKLKQSAEPMSPKHTNTNLVVRGLSDQELASQKHSDRDHSFSRTLHETQSSRKNAFIM